MRNCILPEESFTSCTGKRQSSRSFAESKSACLVSSCLFRQHEFDLPASRTDPALATNAQTDKISACFEKLAGCTLIVSRHDCLCCWQSCGCKTNWKYSAFTSNIDGSRHFTVPEAVPRTKRISFPDTVVWTWPARTLFLCMNGV